MKTMAKQICRWDNRLQNYLNELESAATERALAIGDADRSARASTRARVARRRATELLFEIINIARGASRA